MLNRFFGLALLIAITGCQDEVKNEKQQPQRSPLTVEMKSNPAPSWKNIESILAKCKPQGSAYQNATQAEKDFRVKMNGKSWRDQSAEERAENSKLSKNTKTTNNDLRKCRHSLDTELRKAHFQYQSELGYDEEWSKEYVGLKFKYSIKREEGDSNIDLLIKAINHVNPLPRISSYYDYQALAINGDITEATFVDTTNGKYISKERLLIEKMGTYNYSLYKDGHSGSPYQASATFEEDGSFVVRLKDYVLDVTVK
ncbi:hypothetical protein [Vibrio sp. LaRot3]|uniref:hypothetical protein n=1 Tax=Vibrio sp. LaRot3 TaxID=2998829 RepID=UPI0022CDF385|nr:hypothetical protein [Vibrio sp. LaRot3]MDA0148453.1 hypothetical protein [Vibrio sp. LaRot3]